MRRARRSSEPQRIDITPMIDVVFLLLTFLVFSLALSARYRITNLNLPTTAIGAEAKPTASALLEVAPDGTIAIDGQPVEDHLLAQTLLDMHEADPDLALFIAADEASTTGRLLPLLDQLQRAGFTNLRFLRDRPPAD